jgi:hypothetical protein
MTVSIVRNNKFKKFMGIGDFLPDTILETKFKKEYSNVVKAIVTEKVKEQTQSQNQVFVSQNRPKKK